MKRLFYFFALTSIFCFLIIFSCKNAPDILDSTPGTDNLNNKKYTNEHANDHANQNGKGGKDGEKPTIVSLWVESPNTVLPGHNPVIVHYKVKDNYNIKSITVKFIYDNNDDEFYHILFASKVYKRVIEFNDIQKVREDTILWYGQVDTFYSSTGMLFDQYATTPNPDTYLLFFEVSDGNNPVTHNWTSTNQDLIVKVDADSEKAFVYPRDQVPEIHVTSVIADWKKPSKKKGRYAGELLATISCNQGGFRGKGQWRQVYFNPNDPTQIDSIGRLQDHDGSPYWYFYDDDGDGIKEITSSELYVGPGTYRFYIKTIYHSDFSYDPWQHTQWLWPDEPYAEVTVPE